MDANTYFTTEGHLVGGRKWQAFRGKFAPRSGDIGPSGGNEYAANVSFPKATYTPLGIESTGEPEMRHSESL